VQQLDDEVNEIVNSSSDHTAILPCAVDDADSCGSLVAMTSTDDTIACVTESAAQEVYVLQCQQDDLLLYLCI
jgi:hypothetical protein